MASDLADDEPVVAPATARDDEPRAASVEPDSKTADNVVGAPAGDDPGQPLAGGAEEESGAPAVEPDSGVGDNVADPATDGESSTASAEGGDLSQPLAHEAADEAADEVVPPVIEPDSEVGDNVADPATDGELSTAADLAQPPAHGAEVEAPVVESVSKASDVAGGPAVDSESSTGGNDLSHPLAQDLLLNPSRWRIWPAVAILRWLLRGTRRTLRGLIYRSNPSLGFVGSEIQDVAFEEGRVDLLLSAPGLAAPGSPLPTADIARIVSDTRAPHRGALAAWLDGPGDRFMQAVEVAQASNNAAFALATGGRIEALRVITELAGRSAPLTARQGGMLATSLGGDPEGAIGFATLFIGPSSTVGLRTLLETYTGLPVTIEEFSGAEVPVLRAARLGRPIGRILGAMCELPTAGVDVVLDGGADPESLEWARNHVRHRSLALLCESYVGSPSPVVRVYLKLEPAIVPETVLGGPATLGGLAVLGRPKRPVRLLLTD